VSTTGPIPCFLIVPTDRYRISLRRYVAYDPANARACGASGTAPCGALCVVGTEQHDEAPARGDDPARFPHDDPRWPSACERCGAPFLESDAFQVFPENIYVRADGGAGEYVLRELPAGAMYDATWLHEMDDMRGPDGHSYIVRLPDHTDWLIDGPARGGGHWARTGEAPLLTARPSILTPGYHGWLTNGVLAPC
jgi:hypothetical protein